MTRSRRVEFEDQGVDAISFSNGEFRLGINCWNSDTNVKSKLLVVFSGVKNFQIDSELNSDVNMLSADGEIIHFETNDQHMLLIVIWHGYKTLRENTKSYKFNFDSLQIIAG